MKKQFMKRVLSLLCVVVLCLSMATSAMAASKNVCSSVSGNNQHAVTFTVNTKSNLFGGSVKLTQTKGTALYMGWTGADKYKDEYGRYNIIISKISGGTKKADSRELFWNGTASKTISLQKNAKYVITVSPCDNTTTTFFGFFKGAFQKWIDYPTWSAVKTRGVSYCS